MIAPMAAPRPPPNTPPMMAPVAPPTIAPPTGSCAAASCIGVARAMARQAEDPKARINPVLLLIEFHIEIRPNRGGHRGSHFKSLDSCAGLARKSHPTNARLGGQSDRHVSGVADVLAGGASRRAEYWNLLR